MAEPSPPAQPLEVIACAAHLLGTTPRDILSKAKHRHIAYARFAVAKALHMRHPNYNRIGRILGRDHSTVIYGVRLAEYLMTRDPAYADAVHKLRDLRDGEFLAMQREAACKQHIPMLRQPEHATTTEDRW